MSLPITALYAGLKGLWLVGLGFVVIRQRRRHDVSIGDGGVDALAQAVRAHGNACEYVPIALILLGLAEGMGASGGVLHGFGSLLVAGRLLHGGYFLTGARVMKARVLGMVLTFVVIAGLSVRLLVYGLAGMG
ncbi:MAG TPA: MAPEG family protein [Thermohalobaculum sp.]|nr:MAPEG family protein [Thermohalobaculum sp.]